MPHRGSAAIIRSDKDTLLSGAKASEIRELMEQRGVIVFPEINLTDEEQIAFTHTLGTFAHEDGEGAAEGKDAVYPITMDESINPIASYLKGAFFWHIDGTMSDNADPRLDHERARARADRRRDRVLQHLCRLRRAARREKREIEGLKVVHAMWRSQLYWRPEPSYAELKGWMSRGTNTLPLVWKHRSGRKSLVLGATALQVEGMDIAESEELLVRLRDWATKPQFVYRHTWSAGRHGDLGQHRHHAPRDAL